MLTYVYFREVGILSSTGTDYKIAKIENPREEFNRCLFRILLSQKYAAVERLQYTQ
jgi:hypothetical protein